MTFKLPFQLEKTAGRRGFPEQS